MNAELVLCNNRCMMQLKREPMEMQNAKHNKMKKKLRMMLEKSKPRT